MVKMEKENLVRIEKVPEISFDDWMLKKGYDKTMISDDITIAEFLGGLVTSKTLRDAGKQKAYAKKIAYTREKHQEYKSELENGLIEYKNVETELDMSKEADRAYVRMQIKRNEKSGNFTEALKWKTAYYENKFKYQEEL